MLAVCRSTNCFHPLNSLMLLTNPQYLAKQQQNPGRVSNHAGTSDSLLSQKESSIRVLVPSNQPPSLSLDTLLGVAQRPDPLPKCFPQVFVQEPAPSKHFASLTLTVSQVWCRHLHTSRQETPCGTNLATALAEGAAILISQKEGHFVLVLFFFFVFCLRKPHFAV